MSIEIDFDALFVLVDEINAARLGGAVHAAEPTLDRLFGGDRRLASLSAGGAGGPARMSLAAVPGDWTTGTVRGRLEKRGWGAVMGAPGLILDSAGEEAAVDLFESESLPSSWRAFDAFEGGDYRRLMTIVERTDDVAVLANIYALRPSET